MSQWFSRPQPESDPGGSAASGARSTSDSGFPRDPATPRVPALVRDVGLLLTRILLGVIMMAHGWQKVATNGLDATAAGFAKSGVPLPEVSAWLAAAVELGGGALLVLGLLTPIAGLAIAAVLVGAFVFTHMGQPLFVSEGGWELVAALGLGAVVFALVGPGRLSLDAVLARRRLGTRN